MKQHTKDRLTQIAAEIRTEAFMAAKAKDARSHFSRINRLSAEACDYFSFALEAKAPEPAPEPETFGYSCPELGCDGSEEADESYSTMAAALDAARLHRDSHASSVGIVTFERSGT